MTNFIVSFEVLGQSDFVNTLVLNSSGLLLLSMPAFWVGCLIHLIHLTLA